MQKRVDKARNREEGALIISITTKTMIAGRRRIGNINPGQPGNFSASLSSAAKPNWPATHGQSGTSNCLEAGSEHDRPDGKRYGLILRRKCGRCGANTFNFQRRRKGKRKGNVGAVTELGEEQADQ